jgi:transposase
VIKKAGRITEVVYYDTTNFYFEIDEEDEDVLDECGNVIGYGMRKIGISKEERKLPIVQMGLFMDQNGLPILVEAFPGNTLDHLTLKHSLKNTIDGLDLSRFILIGDRGICVYSNLVHLLDLGHGYIVSKSLLKSKAAEREWTYAEDGYTYIGDGFKYKSRIVEREVLDENKNKRIITEKVLVYWSEDYANRSKNENESYFKLLTKCSESTEAFKINRTQIKGIKRFLSKDILNSDTGELFNSNELNALIDLKKVEDFKRNFGYYQIITSEINMDDETIIEKYRSFTEIENQFCIMKKTLEMRPFYVRNYDDIAAHLLTCVIALLLLCIIQKKIRDSEINASNITDKRKAKTKKKTPHWSMGMNFDRIQTALENWKIEELSRQQYRFSNIREGDIKILLDSFNIDIPLKLFSKMELLQIKKKIKVF